MRRQPVRPKPSRPGSRQRLAARARRGYQQSYSFRVRTLELLATFATLGFNAYVVWYKLEGEDQGQSRPIEAIETVPAIVTTEPATGPATGPPIVPMAGVRRDTASGLSDVGIAAVVLMSALFMWDLVPVLSGERPASGLPVLVAHVALTVAVLVLVSVAAIVHSDYTPLVVMGVMALLLGGFWYWAITEHGESLRLLKDNVVKHRLGQWSVGDEGIAAFRVDLERQAKLVETMSYGRLRVPMGVTEADILARVAVARARDTFDIEDYRGPMIEGATRLSNQNK